jgi:hypothetical protein
VIDTQDTIVALASAPGPAPRGVVRARLQSATHVVDIVGPTRCEILDPAGKAALLARIGYRPGLPLPVLLAAFQRHWRPARVDGVADADTLARLAAVAEAATRS